MTRDKAKQVIRRSRLLDQWEQAGALPVIQVKKRKPPKQVQERIDAGFCFKLGQAIGRTT
jgi:hypothetical protein